MLDPCPETEKIRANNVSTHTTVSIKKKKYRCYRDLSIDKSTARATKNKGRKPSSSQI